MQNVLSISGTVTCITGSDAYAPQPYWDTYTHRQLTQNEIDGLIDNNYFINALSLSPGEYTCLEITFNDPLYIGRVRSYGDYSSGSLKFDTVLKQSSKELSYFSNTANTFDREDIRGVIGYWDVEYWDAIDASRGYFGTTVTGVGPAIPELVSSIDTIVTSGDLSGYIDGVAGKTVRQAIYMSSGVDTIRVLFDSPVGYDTELLSAKIGTVAVDRLDPILSYVNTSDHDVRSDIRYWVGDNGEYGHFEGDRTPLSPVAISGTWDQYVAWSGTGSRTDLEDKANFSFRQLIPTSLLSATGDGIRITLSGSENSDVIVDNASFMLARSEEIFLDFANDLEYEQTNIRGPINRWKQDSGHWGHFEGPPVTIVSGSTPTMYDANVIGIDAEDHEFEPGDYVCLEGTQYYDGYSFVLEFHHSNDHFTIWGIYDYEVFGGNARVRKVISLGPGIDAYGNKRDARDVLPLVEVNFSNGMTGYIIEYSSNGRANAAVNLGPDEYTTDEITSIYDLTVTSQNWLSNTPGPGNNPDYESSMPNLSTSRPSFRTGWREMFTQFTTSLPSPDPAYGYASSSPSWSGDFFVITEAEDPALEGDWTGWTGSARFYDRVISQPWWVVTRDADCIWLTLCYRGPVPVKFGIDFKKAMAWDKHRFFIQLVFCPEGYGQITIPSKPRKWKLQASNNKYAPDNEWVTIKEIYNLDPDEFVSDSNPLDKGIPKTSATGPWLQGEVLDLYRYYRFYIEEVWVKSSIINIFSGAITGYEACHISEIDFVQHQASAGIFPTVITANLFIDEIKEVIPSEHLKGNNTIFYSFSFDEGQTFKVWDGVDWQIIIKNDNGTWKYRDKGLGFSLPEDNNARKALWHALCVPNNRMESSDLIDIPEEAYMYSTAAVSGTTLHFGVGLMSTGDIECMLKGITLRGTIFDPSGETEPQELTFSGGQNGCVIPANNTVTSDWMNFDVLGGYDLLFAFDMGSSNLASKFQLSTPLVYFERYDANSYYLKDVTLSKWTRREGAILLDSIDVRQHDTVTITASGNLLSAGDNVRIYGTDYYNHNDIEVVSATSINFDIDSKHWVETPGSGYVTKRIPIGPDFEYSDVQEGSLICFSGTGSYTSGYTEEVSLPSGMYIITENVCVSEYHAWNLFDSNENLEFHSGQQIELGPVYIGLQLIDGGRSFNKYRIRASRNQVFWEKEFAKEIQFSYSTESSPTLTNESHWTQLVSGTYALPIGPGEFGIWEDFTCSGSYYHFRFKIDSNYGNWYDAIRLAEIEIADSQGGLGGFTAIVPPMGAQFRYLLDDNTYNQYSSGNPYSGNPPEIDIDFKNKKRILQKYRFRAIKNCLYSSSYDYSDTFPPYVYIYGSNQDYTDLNTTVGWTYLTEHTPDQPSAEGAYSDWNDVSAYVTEPYRHYRFVLYRKDGADNSSTSYATPAMTWQNSPAPYVIYYSFYDGSQPPYRAFNQTYDTYSFCNMGTAPQWLTMDFGSNVVINKYRWLCAAGFTGASYPKSWYIQGSKNNSDWVTLHSVANGYPGTYNWTPFYTFTNMIAYRYYRMYVYEGTGGTGMFINEIQFVKLPEDPIVEVSHMDISIEDTIKEFDTIYYTDSFPYHLLTLPAYHSIKNMQIETVEGMYGGYTDQIGTTATGVENVSFVTIVDRNNQLDNGKAISHIGVYADYGSSLNITFKMFKALDAPTYEWYDIENVVQVTHSGNGFQWFELETPEVVEDDGEWYLGWYQPEFPVTMGNYDASPKVAFEYGNYAGTLIHLQETANFKPSLAFRYAGYYTLGTESDPNYFFSTFSPVNDGQTLISPNTLDAVTSGTEIYIYQPCSFTEADTQGELTIKISYIDEEEADYGVPVMTVTGTKYLSIANNAKNIVDGNISTDFNSIREVGETDYARLMFRFNDPVMLNTIRIRPSNNVSTWDDYFPRCFTVQASNSLASFDQLETWEELYKDEGIPLPDYGAEADWSVWMYFDFYDDFYKYYLISFYHWDYATQYVALSDIEFIYTVSGTENIEITEDMNVIYQITVSGGQHDSDTQLLYNSGDNRVVSNVYNTYTDYSQIEVSPGSHFYRGENNLGSLMDRPVAVYKEVAGIKEQINITYPEFAGMGLMAWHPMNEEFGDFSDRSGNNITAYRVGTVGNEEARRYGTGGSNVDGDDSGYARFTLPHHIAEYTICFWFKPGISLYKGCPYSYDIMGGWTSYGAILGNWHISVGRSFLFDGTPYPDTQIIDHIPPGDEDEMGCIYFGNYGGYVRTSRNYWSSNVWYHIAFNANSTGPYKVWINGYRDDDYVWETASDVYPPSEAMIVDPDDIHYSDYGKSNCLYFGLPMKGSLGKRGKFAISDVMHFSQILDDYQVLDIFRMNQQLSEEWDTVYFAETEELQPSDRIIVDFGQELAINKYAFISPLEITSSGVNWDFTASGILGWETLDTRNNDIESALGSEYATDTYYIEAIDSFPVYVFTTPAHKDAEVHWEVEIPFQGGYNDEWEGGYLCDGGLWGGDYTIFRTSNYQTLTSGRYIARGKLRSWWSAYHPDRRVQFKLGHRDSGTQWDIINLGDYVYLSSSTPQEATQTFDPAVKIEGDDYYPGTWSANSPRMGCGPVSYDSYKSGNISGDNVTGFTEVDKRPAISMWYSNTYSMGTDDDNEFVLSNMQPYATIESGSAYITAGPPTQIFMYWNGVQADTKGKIKITVSYAKDPNIAIGQWYNIHNRDRYQYYAFKFNSTTSDNIYLTGISTRSSPILLTVSGDYSSVTSGIGVGTTVLEHGFIKYEPGNSAINCEVIRDGSWLPEPSGICGWEAVGSGDISIRSTFSTVPEYNNPRITNYLIDTTSWVATDNQANIYFDSVSGCTITGGEPRYSDWLHYFTDDDSYHVIDMELSGASDRIAYSTNGYGALFADYHTEDLTVVSGFDYTCSGIYVVEAVDGRSDEIIRITVDSTEHINIGDDIKLYGYFNEEYYEVLDFTSNTIDIQAPHPYITLSGIYNKRIWPEDSIIGAQVISDYDSGYISEISGALVVFDENFYASFINAIYNLSISGTALVNTTTSGVTSAVTTNSGQWTFLDTGRVVSVDVKSDEPAGTFISHGVSFDGRNSFYIYESGLWIEVAKLDGQWKYYDGSSWQNAYKNNLLWAFRQAVDDGGYLFITSDLESVEESEWHKMGAIETVSGSLDFVQIMYGDENVSPSISGYEITFVQRSGIDDLIPDDYAYDLDAGELRGTLLNDIRLEPDTNTEIQYDKKYTDHIRLYVYNDQASGINMQEVALLDYQVPNDDLYLDPYSSLTYQYPLYNAPFDPEAGYTAYASGIYFDITSLRSEHILTGGITLVEQEQVRIQASGIPDSAALFYGQLRIYYDPEMGQPTVTDIITGDFYTTVGSGDNYLYNFFLSNTPVNEFTIELSNDNPTGSGLQRIYEIGVYDYYPDYWEIPNEFNLLETAYTFDASSTTSYSGYTGQQLSPANLQKLIDPVDRYSIPIFTNCYMAIESQLTGFHGKSEELRLYLDRPIEHEAIFYTQVSGNQDWTEHNPTFYETDGEGYYYQKFEEPTNITGIRVLCANTSSVSGSDLTIEYSYYVEATETFPYHLVTFPKSVTLKGITCEVESDETGMHGGYYGQYSDIITNNAELSDMGYDTAVHRNYSYALPAGRYLVQTGKYTSNSFSWIKWKVAQRDNDNQFDVIDLETQTSDTGGLVWFTLSTPWYIPTTGSWYVGLFTPTSRNDFWKWRSGYCTYWKYGGDAVGDNVTGWNLNNNQYYSMSARYSTIYSVGDSVDPDRFISDVTPVIASYSKSETMDEDLIPGTQIWVYQSATSPDTSGRFKITLEVTLPAVASILWSKSIQLINSASGIDFGVTGTSGNTLQLETYYRDHERIAIYNNSPFQRTANARLLPRFSNDYDLDRTVLTSKDGSNWRGLNDGLCIPEDIPYDMGYHNGVYTTWDEKISLNTGVTSGNWISPILEVLDPSSTAAYIYTNEINETASFVNVNNESVLSTIEARASNTKPIHIFMVTAFNTDSTTPAPWKEVYFDSDGNLITWTRSGVPKDLHRGSLSNAVGAPIRYWPMGYQPLWQFWGCLEPSGRGALCMGLEWSGDDGSEESDYDEDWYTIRRVFPKNEAVTDADGLDSSHVHIFKTNYTTCQGLAGEYDCLYPRIVPVFNRVLRHVERYQGANLRKSWQMVDVVYRPEPFYERYQEDYYSDKVFHLRNIFSYNGTSATPEEDNEIDYLYSFSQGDYSDLTGDRIKCAACIDGYVGGLYYWVHFAIRNSYYRTLLVNGTSIEKVFSSVEKSFNFMCEGAPEANRGFWGITNTSVAWYEYNGSALSEIFSVYTDGTKNFSFVTHGATDYNNNLWFIDLSTERVMRVNFETQEVDYSREIKGACSVYPDPHDESAYVYVIRDPQFPYNDCIKIVHASEYDYIEPEVVCAVPGIALVEPFNVRLTGRSLHPDEDYDILSFDPVWGDNGSLSWNYYSVGSPTLPKEQYKQFKITLQRVSAEDISPELDKIRIPKPTVINKIPYKDYKWIYIDTLEQSENTELLAGEHTADLLLWWINE